MASKLPNNSPKKPPNTHVPSPEADQSWSQTESSRDSRLIISSAANGLDDQLRALRVSGGVSNPVMQRTVFLARKY